MWSTAAITLSLVSRHRRPRTRQLARTGTRSSAIAIAFLLGIEPMRGALVGEAGAQPSPRASGMESRHRSFVAEWDARAIDAGLTSPLIVGPSRLHACSRTREPPRASMRSAREHAAAGIKATSSCATRGFPADDASYERMSGSAAPRTPASFAIRRMTVQRRPPTHLNRLSPCAFCPAVLAPRY
jgi:hypothetical protein